jgi:hypothetical protein
VGVTANRSAKPLNALQVLLAVAVICAGVVVVPVVLPVSTAASSPPCSEGGVCIAGDTGPGGGIVFYVHDSGTFACGSSMELTCSYLEAAPTSGIDAWTDVLLTFSGTTDQWLSSNSALGHGYKNTTDFVAQNETANRAITNARAFRGPNNLSDWFLPSERELEYLYARMDLVGGFQQSLYKASSGCCSRRLGGVHFGTGAGSAHLYKSDAHYVRPIRAFGVLEIPATTSTTVAATTSTTVAPTTSTTVAATTSTTVAPTTSTTVAPTTSTTVAPTTSTTVAPTTSTTVAATTTAVAPVVAPTPAPLVSWPSPTSTSTTTVEVTAPETPDAVIPDAETIRRLPNAFPALLKDPKVAGGSLLSVTLPGFAPDELVYLLVASEPQVLGITRADAAGEVSLSGQLPTGLNGSVHTLAVFAPESGLGFSQPIRVAAAVLPRAGSSVPIFPLAVLSIALGLIAMTVRLKPSRVGDSRTC